MSARRDHPRSRGENGGGVCSDAVVAGSSPLTRGKLRGWPGRRRCRGIIPAHAGKTPPARPRRLPSTDHPRSRGENFQSWVANLPAPGSSPLTRGKRRRGHTVFRGAGIIPAHAGKTSGPTPRTHSAWDHPRSRGENNVNTSASTFTEGSSPLTRGKPLSLPVGSLGIGIIPAHAGKTAVPPGWLAGHRDHPRSRGENYATRRNPANPTGSSPLTRGKRRDQLRHRRVTGIIPAHAGKTSKSR